MSFRDYQHRQRATAAIRDGKAVASDAQPHSLHLQLIALERDIKQLRTIGPRAERTDQKRDVLLPRWKPWAQKHIDRGVACQNPIFVECIIWLFDTGQMQLALDWADIAIEQGQKMPTRFKSGMPTFVADTVLEWSEAEAQHGRSVEPYFSHVFERVKSKWRLHEEINAKWFKFAALLLLRDDNGKPRATAVDDVNTLQMADSLLEQAEKFYRKIQVATLRRQISARIRKLTS